MLIIIVRTFIAIHFAAELCVKLPEFSCLKSLFYIEVPTLRVLLGE